MIRFGYCSWGHLTVKPQNCMKRWFLNWLCLGVSLLDVKMLSAQDSVSKQIWPEVEAYYRINERFRLYSSISGTRSNSEYTDGTGGIYIDFFAKPWLRERIDKTQMTDSSMGYYWWFRMGYSYSNSPPGAKQKTVNILETETNNNCLLYTSPSPRD